MPGREQLRAIGRSRGHRLVLELAQVARESRLELGLSRGALASQLEISVSKLARWERGLHPYPDLADAAELLRVLGQDLVLKWFPVGGVLRDAGHARLTEAFLRLVPPTVPRRLESPMPLAGDLRAWDVWLRLDDVTYGVAIETNLRDWQALLRREEQKMRDSRTDRLILVLLDTHANRAAVRQAGIGIRQALPLDGRAILRALREGRDPGADGLLFLTAGPSPGGPRRGSQPVVRSTRKREPTSMSRSEAPPADTD